MNRLLPEKSRSSICTWPRTHINGRARRSSHKENFGPKIFPDRSFSIIARTRNNSGNFSPPPSAKFGSCARSRHIVWNFSRRSSFRLVRPLVFYSTRSALSLVLRTVPRTHAEERLIIYTFAYSSNRNESLARPNKAEEV